MLGFSPPFSLIRVNLEGTGVGQEKGITFWTERFIINSAEGTSLVVQWLRIRLPIQGTRVQSLVQEDPTCRGATKPVHHNY